jgi:hypothetical protein
VVRTVAQHVGSHLSCAVIDGGSCRKLTDHGKRALLLIWDNASWHRSQAARTWIRAHNHQVKREKTGVRIVVCPLPIKSPWLNLLEAYWVHGKHGVVEADGRHCQVNDQQGSIGVASGVLGSFRGPFITPSGTCEPQNPPKYPPSERDFVTHQLT